MEPKPENDGFTLGADRFDQDALEEVESSGVFGAAVLMALLIVSIITALYGRKK
jgi:hypothetical protein